MTDGMPAPVTDGEFDWAGLHGAAVRAMHEDGYSYVSAADVAEVHRALRADWEPAALVGRAIAGHLRLLEGGSDEGE